MIKHDIRIRRATPDDVPLVFGLIRDLAEYERLLDQFVATEDLLREQLFGARPYAEVLIAEDDDGAAGFALFFHNYSTFLAKPGIYLEDLFVLPDRRRRGIGKALLIEIAKIAVERGCGRLEWSVLDWNEPAINFYKHLGAKLMDDWTTCRMTGESLKALARQTAKNDHSQP